MPSTTIFIKKRTRDLISTIKNELGHDNYDETLNFLIEEYKGPDRMRMLKAFMGKR